MNKELNKRLWVAFTLMPLAFLAGWFGGIYWTLMVAALCSFGGREVTRLYAGNSRSARAIGMIFATFAPLLVHKFGLIALVPWELALFLVAGASSVIWDVNKGMRSLGGVLAASNLFAFPMSTMVVYRDSEIWTTNWLGLVGVIYVWGSVWLYDASAYFVGKSIGKHKLSPTISPKKTIEGAVGGALIMLIWVLGARLMLKDIITVIDSIIIGILIPVFSTIGDLMASLIKRNAGVKDSGGFFPGHGGIYDRFDSTIPTFVVVYLYFLARGIMHL